MATMLLIQGCVLAPVTLWTIHLSGKSEVMYFLITSLSMAVLVPNLADMPTRITMPIFFVSLFLCVCMNLINLMIILL